MKNRPSRPNFTTLFIFLVICLFFWKNDSGFSKKLDLGNYLLQDRQNKCVTNHTPKSPETAANLPQQQFPKSAYTPT